MGLTDTFWQLYELDLQEVKLRYLRWALKYLKEPDVKYRHLFVWDEYDRFCIVNSKYGRAFSISPFGIGAIRGIPKTAIRVRRPWEESEVGLNLKNRITANTGKIREAIKKFLVNKDIESARNTILNWFHLKLGPGHEQIFDQIQYRRDDTGKLRKEKAEVSGLHS